MELRHLEHFLAVADERNFTRAARRLHIAQSGLSVSVGSLERSLGVRLFERTSHAVELTDAGTVLLDYAQAIMQMVREANAAVEEMADGARGSVRVGILQAMVLPRLGDLLQQFQRRRPLVSVELRGSLNGSVELLELLHAGQLDLTFIGTRPGADHPGVRTLLVRDEPMMLLLPSGDELLALDPVPLAALAGRRFVEFPTGWGTRRLTDAALAEAGVERDVVLEVSDVVTVAEFVRTGVGLAFLPRSAVPTVDGLHLRSLEPAPRFEIRLASSRNRPLPPAARILQQVVHEFYAETKDEGKDEAEDEPGER